MDAVINGTTYTMKNGIYTDVEKVWVRIDTDFETAASFGDEPTLTVMFNGTPIKFNVVQMKSITAYDDGTEITWLKESPETVMRKELAEANSELDGIRSALKALGTGIPTLSKLTAFLTAVKEAIRYE